MKPAWLEALFAEKYFVPCSIHVNAKKNEKNICCIDCFTSICPHCVHSHRFHRLLQIRRYVYHEVVRLDDLENLMDCSGVQAYTINSSKVLFIKKRPQNRHFKGSGNYCTSCDRSLQEPYVHCSVGCKTVMILMTRPPLRRPIFSIPEFHNRNGLRISKAINLITLLKKIVDFVLKHYKDLSPYLRKCKILQLGPDFFVPQEVGDEVIANETFTNETQNSTIVDCDEPRSWSSSSSGSESMSNTFCIGFVRKKRTSLYLCGRSANYEVSEEEMPNSMSRRKGIPRRSPFC